MIGKSIFKTLLSPLGLLLLIGAAGWLLKKRRARLGRGLITFAVVMLYVLSTPLVSRGLLIGLQVYPAIDGPPFDRNAQAIVVLGADQRTGAAEFLTADTVSQLTLERVRYGAFLAQRTGLPVLTTGGTLRPSKTSLALMMKRTLEDEFGVRVRWLEDKSRDTRENAQFTAAILQRDGVTKILLVTHAWHMPRAKAAFESAGLVVEPAPTAFRTIDSLSVTDFLPTPHALYDSTVAFHEWLGRAWYAM